MNTMQANSTGAGGSGNAGMVRFFDVPAPGRFHSLSADTDDWESFVLVLEMRNEGMYPECVVVPGSMDVRKGGPDDLLIKHPDYEKCWFLDLSQVRTIRADALLPGFAALTGMELSRIRHELELYRNETESGDYRYGPPFIGETDSRRRCHADLGALMETADKEAANRYWTRLASSFLIEPGLGGGVRGSRHSGIFDYLSKRAEMDFESASECSHSLKSGAERSLPVTGLMSFLQVPLKPIRREGIALTFTPVPGELPGGDAGFVCVEIDFEENRIVVEAICEANPGAFDGIQLRRCSDGFVIGTIRGGRMVAALVPELEKGIYFARPGDVPLKGEWEQH